jgi:hypothetical protein
MDLASINAHVGGEEFFAGLGARDFIPCLPTSMIASVLR